MIKSSYLFFFLLDIKQSPPNGPIIAKMKANGILQKKIKIGSLWLWLEGLNCKEISTLIIKYETIFMLLALLYITLMATLLHRCTNCISSQRPQRRSLYYSISRLGESRS